jgi:hypothetical protein
MTINSRDKNKDGFDLIGVNREFDWNEIDENHPPRGKHDTPRIPTSQGIWVCDDLEKVRINP